MAKPGNIKGDGMFWAEKPTFADTLVDVAHLQDLSKRPDYFEWWYFDATTDSGERVVTELHYSNFFLSPRIPSVLLQIRTASGEVHSRGHMFRGGWQSEGGISASATEVNVRFGERASVTGKYPDYHLKEEHENMGVDLRFHFVTPGWKAPTDMWFPLAYYDEMTKDEFSHLIMLSAEVEGKIRIGDKVSSVKGRGYHDHQWGNIAFRDVISYWYWGRAISGDQMLCLMNSAKAPGGNRYPDEVNGIIVGDKGKIILVTNQVKFKGSDFIHEDVTDKDVPHTLHFETAGENKSINVEATIKLKEIAGKTDLRGKSKHLRAYLRLLGECNATINIKGKSTKFKGDVILGDMIFH